MVLSTFERSEKHFLRVCTDEFKKILDRLNLMDLPIMEDKWTWFNQRLNPACLQIDRFLVPVSNQLQAMGMCQKLLQRTISEHFPICLEAEGIK